MDIEPCGGRDACSNRSASWRSWSGVMPATTAAAACHTLCTACTRAWPPIARSGGFSGYVPPAGEPGLTHRRHRAASCRRSPAHHFWPVGSCCGTGTGEWWDRRQQLPSEGLGSARSRLCGDRCRPSAGRRGCRCRRAVAGWGDGGHGEFLLGGCPMSLAECPAKCQAQS